MLNVFLTIDTETYPKTPNWRETGLSEEIERDIYGATPQGEFGLRYQIEKLNAYGLKAVFFVEALFACEVGLAPLRNIVETVQSGGHDVQLHIQPEWVAWMTEPILPGVSGDNMKDFSQHQ